MKKKLIIFSIILFVIAGVLFAFLFFNGQKNSQQTSNKNILETINTYQERYFEIIKRHDALLNLTGDEETMKDLKELKILFDEVKGNISKDCSYYIEYEMINAKYKENSGQTTLEMNEFASEKYNAFDKLLNDTYKEVKNKISPQDFEELKQSQRIWLKDVEDYNNIYLSKGFGTIGTLVKFDYEINMRGFRALLLMLYL